MNESRLFDEGLCETYQKIVDNIQVSGVCVCHSVGHFEHSPHLSSLSIVVALSQSGPLHGNTAWLKDFEKQVTRV